jgi:hypothetical protein
MRVEDAMNQVIRFAIGALSLCGALAVLPGVAQAQEPHRAVAGHVERGHERGWGGEHGHGRREPGHERAWRDGRGRWEHGGARRPGC